MFSFFPNAQQANNLDKKIRLSLADSLIHIADQSEAKLEFDFNRLLPLIKSIQSGVRYPSTTFFIYAQLVLAIVSQDNQQAINFLNQLCAEKPLPKDDSEPCRTLSFSDSVHLPNHSIYLAAMDTDPNITFYMGAPSEELAIEFKQRIQSSYRLMKKIMPELAQEFKVLVSDIVIVVGDDQAEYQFDGGSSYFLWGALFLNANSHQNEIMMLEVLVHESAHMLLYACASDEPLVNNPDDELYPSPLRHDPRPMDGIYHATFVSARMHWAMQQLIASGYLNESDKKIALKARDEDTNNFWAGYKVVCEHAKLTKTGQEIMDAAAEYMRKQTN